MRRSCLLPLLGVLGCFLSGDGASGADWLRFRGPNGSGVSPDAKGLPTSWNDKENISWKAELPGTGLSSPIVIGDRVIITAADGIRQDKLLIVCLDANTGKQRWRRAFWATGRTMCHQASRVAAPTPASDGQRILASFSTNDAVCLDLDGNLLWFRGVGRDFPNASNSLGMASSPIIVGETVVLPVENDADSFALGLDVADGTTRWKADRPAVANWTSPVVLGDGKTPGEQSVLMQSRDGLTAYNAYTGAKAWTLDQQCSSVPSSVVAGDTAFVPLSRDSGGTIALRLQSGKSPRVLWKQAKLSPSTGTFIAHQGRIYSEKSGVLTCADVATGKELYKMRLKGPFSGSPVIAENRLYCFNRNGVGQVVDLSGEEGEVIFSGELGEGVLCTPAVSGNALYVRSDKTLWKIAETK
ncbi:MAG: PQQ-like beta-propeller repeat protein [Planctomycetales bacterium]